MPLKASLKVLYKKVFIWVTPHHLQQVNTWWHDDIWVIHKLLGGSKRKKKAIIIYNISIQIAQIHFLGVKKNESLINSRNKRFVALVKKNKKFLYFCSRLSLQVSIETGGQCDRRINSWIPFNETHSNWLVCRIDCINGVLRCCCWIGKQTKWSIRCLKSRGLPQCGCLYGWLDTVSGEEASHLRFCLQLAITLSFKFCEI